jgi:PTS system fructose-specific IIC component/PTS system nitrogen regulatory IIA component
MLLSEVFLPEFIICDLKGRTKGEVFEEMVDLFCRTTQKNIGKNILTALWERENRRSTSMQNGIAIPHGKTDAIDSIFGVIGISRQGIDYDAIDGKPVYMILMIIAPPIEAEKHLSILKSMADLLRKPAFYGEVLDARNEEAVHTAIKRHERGQPGL